MSLYQHILVAIDFSEQTPSVYEKAVALQKIFNSRISFIHVVEYIPAEFSDTMISPPVLEMNTQLFEIAEDRLKKLISTLGLRDAGCFVEQGNTRKEILRVAEEKSVDLIVIGSHGRSGVQLLLGSTANAVLHGAPCDVLAARIQE